MSILEKHTSIFIDESSQLLDRVNFSEIIIIAALGKRIESEPLAKDKLNFSPDCVFNGDDISATNLPYEKFKKKLMEGFDNSAPLSEEQIEDAFEILKNGQAKRDVRETIVDLLKAIPKFPVQVLTDIPNIFKDPTDIPRLPGFDVASKTIISIVRPNKEDFEKNRIFRLAILAYARMNGVNIEETNLIDLCDFLETGTESDFNKLVANGLEAMKDQYGVNDIKSVADRLHSTSQECMNKTK